MRLELSGRQLVCIKVVRGDLIHPQVSGNKWFKLKLNLKHARRINATAVVSFGGAWSNHLHALAAAGKACGLPTLGIVRGAWRQSLTPMLQDAVDWGMRLIMVSNEDYRLRYDPKWQQRELPQLLEAADLTRALGYTDSVALAQSCYVVPEGGSNVLGVQGTRQWAEQIYSLLPAERCLFMPVGSGGTLAGFAAQPSSNRLYGVAVVRAGESLQEGVSALLREGVSALLRQEDGPLHCNETPWQILSGYENRGYGRWDQGLLDQLKGIESQTGLSLEPVYSGKAFVAMLDLISKGVVDAEKAVFVHTGGLQGRRGSA